MNNVLEVKAVQKNFTQADVVREVLKQISATFYAGKSYALMGPSGVGKSTLMSLLAALEQPTSGDILLDGRSIVQDADYAEYARRFLFGIMFQYPHLILELSVIENVMLKALIAGHPEHEARKLATQVLLEVGLQDFLNTMPGALSGGQQQRVALARAIVHRPLFLLADEPTAHIDVENRALMVDLLSSYTAEYGMGIIISTHDAYVSQRMDVVLTLQNGLLQ